MPRRALVLLALALACASPPPSHVTGTVTYRERIALPAGAVVHVTLLDVSMLDMPPRVVTERMIHPEGQVPVPFALSFDAKEIEKDHRYGIRAAIEDASGRPLWVSPSVTPVLTGGAPDALELVLRRVASAAAPAGPRVLAYDCPSLSFRVEVSKERAVVFLPGRSVPLAKVVAATGAKYTDGKVTFWSKGDDASLTVDGAPHTGCRARASLAP